MKIRKRIRRSLNVVKSTFFWGGIGSAFGAYSSLKSVKDSARNNKEEHLEFLHRLRSTTNLAGRILEDAYEMVKEHGLPVSFDPEDLREYEMEARQIWSPDIVFNLDDDDPESDSMLH